MKKGKTRDEDTFTRAEIARVIRAYERGCNKIAHPGIPGATLRAIGQGKNGPMFRARMMACWDLLARFGVEP